MSWAHVWAPGFDSRRRSDSARAFSDLEYCQSSRAIPATSARATGIRVRGWSQAGSWAGRTRGSSEGTVRGFDMKMGEWEKGVRRASQDLWGRGKKFQNKQN